MLHKNRVWQVKDLAAEALAGELQRCTWCGCQGFRAGGVLWLNDSTSPDGGQEFAVVRESTGRQFESVTVNWCTAERLQVLVAQYVQEAADFIDVGGISDWRLTPESINHPCHPCSLCA
jgi:hypothetical protein